MSLLPFPGVVLVGIVMGGDKVAGVVHPLLLLIVVLWGLLLLNKQHLHGSLRSRLVCNTRIRALGFNALYTAIACRPWR